MRHFQQLPEAALDRLFHRPPAPFGMDADRTTLATALGATLYSPATRVRLAEELAGSLAAGVVSRVVCLEDAIADGDVPYAEANAAHHLRAVAGREVPMVFVRVRSVGQIGGLLAGLGPDTAALTGFVLPKFDGASGAAYLAEVARGSERVGRRLWAMPVIETPAVMARESRQAELLAVRDVLDGFADHVLAVRIGATDLSAVYGLRRPRELTVYDVRVVADAIADVVNLLGRPGRGFPVTGGVWEYFPTSERLFKPLLRETPFEEHHERELRAKLLAEDLDGFIREVVLDRANGLTGKSVIHPSHVAPVHALSVVSHEEHCDALAVLAAHERGGGVRGSDYGNKMNEANPHRTWAERVLVRAHVFGVARPDVSFVDLLGATLDL